MNNFLTLDKKITLKSYVQRPFKQYQLMSEQEIFNGSGGTLIVDTETYQNYHLIAFKDIKTQKIIKFELPGELNKRKLAWILQSYRIIGFNIIKYDLPLIWLVHASGTLEQINEASKEIIYNNARPKDIGKKYNFIMFPTNHIDLIEVCPLRGSLKLYGGRLHSPRIQDLPFNVDKPLEEWQIPIVADYCINDLDVTELLLNNLKEQLQLREDLTKEYGQNVMSKSDAQIAETVISIELKRLTGEWPQRPKIIEDAIYNYIVPSYMIFQTPALQRILNIVANTKFQVDNVYQRLLRPKELEGLSVTIGNSIYRMGLGGLHSSETCVVHKSDEKFELYDRDVASYYPAVILNQRLYPQHLGESFLQVYQSIVERRIAAKKAKNISVSENLKVTINGTFGKTGSPYSILYSPNITIQITLTGQLALLMLIEKLELSGIQIVSANTDGIVIKCSKSKKQEMLNIISAWEKLTGFITEETIYKAVYSRDVNAYLAIGNDNKIKGKNVFYDPWRGKSAKDAYWRFQKNPTAQICIEAIEELILKNVPIEKTIGECKDITKFVCVKNVKGGAHKDSEYLGKVIRWYYAKNIFGTINYIESNNKVPDSEGGKPCMDLPNDFPTDINYDWYINRTIEMLYDLAYYNRPKQFKFF